MRIFYAAYLLDEPYATLINAVRLLCEPGEKHLAHLTIRGPYREPLPAAEIDEINRTIKGTSIRVLGGTFFDPKQSTVYLACSASYLPFVWHKPDYDYQPHITLYDGDSLNIAQELRAKLVRYPINFEFAIDSLHLLTSTAGQQDLTLKGSISESFVRAFFAPLGRSLSDTLLLPEDVRLLLVDELLRVLTDLGSRAPFSLQYKKPFDFTDLLKPPRVFGYA